MNDQRCTNHNYFAVPYPDQTVKIECITCCDAYLPTHGKDDEIVNLSLQCLKGQLEQFHKALDYDPISNFWLVHRMPKITSQIKILTDWLIEGNSITLPSKGSSLPQSDLISNLPSKTDPTSNPSQTIDFRSLSPEEIKQLDIVEDLALHSKRKRKKGEGSGEIIYRRSNPTGKNSYDQMFFKVSVWHKGQRQRVKSFYVPRRLEAFVIRAQKMRLPIKDIIKKINPKYDCSTL